jgi:hypothetical protein
MLLCGAFSFLCRKTPGIDTARRYLFTGNQAYFLLKVMKIKIDEGQIGGFP